MQAYTDTDIFFAEFAFIKNVPCHSEAAVHTFHMSHGSCSTARLPWLLWKV